MREINKIIIHCSATPEGREVTKDDIDLWHRQRGFRCIGYHFVVELDGKVEIGRELKEIGAHCKGQNNHSIGICYVGGLEKDCKTPKDTRTNAQKQSMIHLITELKKRFPKAKVCGHRDYANKACPCFNAREEYKYL